MENIIVVKQLPIIEEKLKNLSEEIDEKINRALSLVVCDETIKEVKKMRADLNNDFKDLENQRKEVKESVMNPYNQFEEIYKTYVTNKFKEADAKLKEKIDYIENAQKEEKKQKVREYFEEYAESLKIDFVSFENANINITLTASEKSLKEQAKAFLDKVNGDLELIDSQDHAVEILLEYKNDLNVSRAITTIVNRYKELERMKQIEEQKKEEEKKAQIVEERVEKALSAPTKIEIETKEEVLQLTFTVRATRNKLKELKDFLVKGGYDYE